MRTLDEKIEHDLEMGHESENQLMKLMVGEGYACFKASEKQDRYEHWDFAVKENGGFTKIDVKSLKKSSLEGYTWIEFKNINGNDGWIICESMDVLAFEREDRFELIKRAELLPLIEELIKKADLEDVNGDITYCSVDNLNYYRKYSRVGRKDLMVKAKFDDFKHLIYNTIYKK